MRRTRAGIAAPVAEIPKKCNRIAVWIVARTGELDRYAHVARVRTAGIPGRWMIDVHDRDRHRGRRTRCQSVSNGEAKTIRTEIIRCRCVRNRGSAARTPTLCRAIGRAAIAERTVA